MGATPSDERPLIAVDSIPHRAVEWWQVQYLGPSHKEGTDVKALLKHLDQGRGLEGRCAGGSKVSISASCPKRRLKHHYKCKISLPSVRYRDGWSVQAVERAKCLILGIRKVYYCHIFDRLPPGFKTGRWVGYKICRPSSFSEKACCHIRKEHWQKIWDPYSTERTSHHIWYYTREN